MIETLKLPILYNAKTGLPDAQLLTVKQKIYEYVDQRMHGSIIQRQQIDQRSLNVNVDATPEQVSATPESMDELDKKIKALELELAQAPSLPPPVEVLPVESVTENVKTVLPASLRLRD